jgi:rhodanese-related sulfurtransferase
MVPTVDDVKDLDEALKLDAKTFKSQYGFSKPTPGVESIILYCRSGKRAGNAGNLLRDKFGYDM